MYAEFPGCTVGALMVMSGVGDISSAFIVCLFSKSKNKHTTDKINVLIL